MRPTILGLESNEVVLLVESFIFIQSTSMVAFGRGSTTVWSEIYEYCETVWFCKRILNVRGHSGAENLNCASLRDSCAQASLFLLTCCTRVKVGSDLFVAPHLLSDVFLGRTFVLILETIRGNPQLQFLFIIKLFCITSTYKIKLVLLK